MTDRTQTVSVLITTYYRNEPLRAAIESALNQTYESVQVVVVDDSGEGFARDVVDDYDVGYLAKDVNEGQISTWNAGPSQCCGTYVQLLDDDDQLHETKLEKQVPRIESSREVGAVYSGLTWESGGTNLPDETVRGDVLTEVLTLDIHSDTNRLTRRLIGIHQYGFSRSIRQQSR